MKHWKLGALVGACVGVAVYLLATHKPEAVRIDEPVAAVARETVPPAPAAPVVLARVVEVIDLDPLLDPAPRPDSGVPFEEESPTVPVSAPGAPAFIPPAGDATPITAPMPREHSRTAAITAVPTYQK
jgi:hypothetical protein